jgi:hypothetical protein
MKGTPQKDSKRGVGEDAAFKSNTANSFQLKQIFTIIYSNWQS